MKHFVTKVVGILLLLGSNSSLRAQQFFNSFEGEIAPSTGTQVLKPIKYQLETANNDTLEQYLHQLNTNPNNAGTINLPTPNGGNRIFKIWKTSIMPPALQAKYKSIETFTAVALSNPNVTAKIDYTLNGFHAMVFDGDNSFFIDPYTTVADGYYMVYFRNDYHRSSNQDMVCQTVEDLMKDANGVSAENLYGSLSPIAEKQFGSILRTYRLALSCTGEYAQAVGGTMPTTASVFSAMVTTMNRVNGVYERELGVTMNFINNEDTLIYLNPNTDPFTANNNGATLLTQNAQNTGTVIGAANYDIGHIFSTGGGGIAYVGCVCNSTSNVKAEGVTGSPNPVGDAFDIDYVAHEMGHEFGAQHPFNSNSGDCINAGVDSVAYEPGSGSTIMAYAGICGADNLQLHSDDYFHAKSLDQISNYITNSATCAVTSTGQNPPILPTLTDTFNIPYQTPFELTAPLATATPSDTLTYCWEEWDLGNFQQAEDLSDTFTLGPTFRSFLPTESNTRVFPQISAVINNNLEDVGERVPIVARALHFKVTARNIVNGFGTFNFSDNELTLNVINTGTPFKVDYPNAATDSVKALSQVTVTWDIAQTNIAPINTDSVAVFLSVDGGYTYPFILATAVPNTGSDLVTMPDTLTATARIKVKGYRNVFFDISDNNFSIYNAALSVHDVQLNNNISVYPNPTSNFINVTNNGAQQLNVVLYNVIGQKIWNGIMQQTLSIPAESLSRGVYYLNINDEKSGAKIVKSITLQ